ncbi:NADP-dependent oxidoreductase [Allokutzneria sp. A3M-2-11 16]|uniref:quinone oxidoreductase family protein n=1 Tax=Allokutzneria sp. A3M-2-11 16 TaxID=2962043 RepID=UPI0020B73AEC|nr:NADP-dependent oxidoreductase [Allokutzneria sp. A3M-2-11 16]MCP3802624.1 NADP-dependent oxidoreductase [Allokutzneria sp. A3M-2-11 16]
MTTPGSAAVQLNGYGGPEVLELREVQLGPVPEGEVRIATIAAPVNRADVEIRRGHWPIERADPFPYTPGLEVLGEVVETGPGVQWPPVGQRVITMMQRLGGIHGERPGGYATHVTVRAEAVAAVPEELDPYAVAAVGLAGVTAYEGLRRLEIRPGHTVVVHGASGGVGSVAVRMAEAMGAKVIGTSSRTLAERSLLDELGPRSVDGVLETLGERTFSDSVAVLRRGGRLCLVGALTGSELGLSAWDLIQELVLTGYSTENLTGDDLREDIAMISGWLGDGTLTPPPYQVVPLAEAARAHRVLEEGGTGGRVLLVP